MLYACALISRIVKFRDLPPPRCRQYGPMDTVDLNLISRECTLWHFRFLCLANHTWENLLDSVLSQVARSEVTIMKSLPSETFETPVFHRGRSILHSFLSLFLSLSLFPGNFINRMIRTITFAFSPKYFICN